jgi:hypothetical protein
MYIDVGMFTQLRRNTIKTINKYRGESLPQVASSFSQKLLKINTNQQKDVLGRVKS